MLLCRPFCSFYPGLQISQPFTSILMQSAACSAHSGYKLPFLLVTVNTVTVVCGLPTKTMLLERQATVELFRCNSFLHCGQGT